jgi:hypothetical protein
MMRPLHPNDVANQAVLMNRVGDAIANSITAANPVKPRTSDVESSWFDKSTVVRRALQSDDFSFPR